MPKKGQQLFVRRVADPAELDALAARGAIPILPSDLAWVGFLAGEPVALATASLETGAAVIEMLVVDRSLLRKRIGTVLLREIEADLGGNRLDVRNGVVPEAFLVANGFGPSGNRFTRATPGARNS